MDKTTIRDKASVTASCAELLDFVVPIINVILHAPCMDQLNSGMPSQLRFTYTHFGSFTIIYMSEILYIGVVGVPAGVQEITLGEFCS